MASFYGNIKNNSRASFIFDKIYPSRKAMDAALSQNLDSNQQIQGDGIFINRYVLINYGYTIAGQYAAIDPEDCEPALDRNGNFNTNTTPEQYLAKEVNRTNYTSFYLNVSNEYVRADRSLTANDLASDARYYKKVNFVDRYGYPATNNAQNNGTLNRVENTYFKSNRNDDALKYGADYHLTVWMKIYCDNQERYIQVGRLRAEAPSFELITDAPGEGAPHFDLVQSSDISYVYHSPKNWDVRLNEHTENKDLNGNTRSIKYPYFNSDGFDETTTHRDGNVPAAGSIPAYNDTSTTNQIKIKEYNLNGTTYPDHIFQKIDLTPDTYIYNWYYYYTGTATGNNIPDTITATNQVTFTGNEEYQSNRVYFMKTQKMVNGQLSKSAQNDSRQITIQLPAIGNAVSDLYDVLYGSSGNNQPRPYNRADLFRYQGVNPYNNITNQDKISMGWAMVEFKEYISELRLLSHGANEGNITVPSTSNPGLQSDWTLDDYNAFGYIYHKPRLLWSNPNLANNTETTKTNSGNASSFAETDYYTMHSIEYIYDNYTAANTSLFGINRNGTTTMQRPGNTANGTNASRTWLNLRI